MDTCVEKTKQNGKSTVSTALLQKKNFIVINETIYLLIIEMKKLWQDQYYRLLSLTALEL